MERTFSDQELARREKLQKIREMGLDPFGQRFERTHFSSDIKDMVAGLTHDEVIEKDIHVVVAGRIMFIRKMGKASFFSIKDKKGLIQVLYIN